MGNASGYYDRQYSIEDLQRLTDMNNHDTVLDLVGPNAMDTSGMVGGGQTLDEIINQNNKEMQRRRSLHHSHQHGSSRSVSDQELRRPSMLEFGSESNNDLEGFQFDPTSIPPTVVMQHSGNIAQRRLDSQRARRQISNESLALNTNFPTMAPAYTPVSSSSQYGHNINSSDSLAFDMSGNYVTDDLLMRMDFSTSGLENGNNSGMNPRNAFTQNNFAGDLTTSPIQRGMPTPISSQMHDPGGGGVNSLGAKDAMEKLPKMQVSDQLQNLQTNRTQDSLSMANTGPADQISGEQGLSDFSPARNPQPIPNLDVSADANGMPFQVDPAAGQQVVPQYRNAYSASGFDMLGVLTRVASRPKPQINIGAVDMSCAFVVCDVTQHDLPIVYCSDVFERLTAYTKHEILGRNCRFLQAPDGKIQAGVKRKYVDDQSVLRIKNMITQRQETQISLINYRKGGQPFMNLLTMIPIAWDSDEMKYYVGFQVDLVEQPTSITNKNPGKSCNA